MQDTLSPDLVTLLDALSDAAVIVDRDGRIVFANTRSEGLFGYAVPDLVGRLLEDLLPPRLRERHVSLRDQFARAPEPRRMGNSLSLVAQRADGTEVPVDISLNPLGVPPASLTLACVRDMTEYARLVDAAWQAEERYRMVVTTASEVFYRIAMDRDAMRGTVEFVSPQCEKVTGYPPEAFIANASLWIDSVHPDDRHILFQTTQAILRDGAEGSRYYRLKHRDSGEYRWIADRIVPLLDEHGLVTGYQGVARDITERRRFDEERQRLEEDLRQAQKMEAIGRLASVVAHDFNNLITVILASVDAARGRGVQAESIVLDEIGHAAERASDLTRKLLTLGREQPAAPRTLDLSRQVAQSQALIRRTLPESIDLQLALDASVWPVRLDAGQFDQVVLNLTANARDAMPQGGTFSITIRNLTISDAHFVSAGGLGAGEYVQVTFADDGSGMDHATIAHAFEPFYTTKPLGKGTGLGLASVYGIVKQHRGDVQIQSEPGRGTRVVMHFPRSHAPFTPEGDPPATAGSAA